jgi:hypothetical protein
MWLCADKQNQQTPQVVGWTPLPRRDDIPGTTSTSTTQNGTDATTSQYQEWSSATNPEAPHYAKLDQ